MSNTSLWEKVCTTDPNHTKEFNRGGGFKGTAINPTYQMLKATEVFGPVGMGFGWDIIKEDYVPGADGDVNHVIRLNLWYRVTPKFIEMMPEAESFLDQKCFVSHFGQTTFVGKNKYGVFTDEEAPKKSLTDAISKCLSCLGFSADIHMGLYDSNKYVNDRRKEFGSDKHAAPVPTIKNESFLTEVKEKLDACTDRNSLETYWASLNIGHSHPFYSTVKIMFTEASARIKSAAVVVAA